MLAIQTRAAEAAGLARLWAPELYRSSTIPLAVAAGATERIELGTGIALAFTRSPMIAALEALDRWRTRAESPLTSRAAAEVARAVVRSCEGALRG